MKFINLSQRDSRWKNDKLGFSPNLTLGDYGCLATDIGILAGLTPKEVNERMKGVNGFANKTYIIWAKIQEAIPWLEFEWRGYSYDNDKVKKAIAENGACLVEVDFDGKISTPKDKHWVVFIGNGRMIDPWTGKEKATNWYPKLTGYAVIKIKEKQPEYSVDYVKQLEKDKIKLWEDVEEVTRSLNGKITEITDLRKELERAKNKHTEALQELGELLSVSHDISAIKGGISEALSIEDAKRKAEYNFKIMEKKAGESAEQSVRLEAQIKDMISDIQGLKDDKIKNEGEILDLEKEKEVLEVELKEVKKNLITLQTSEEKTIDMYSGWDLIGIGITKLIRR